MAHAVTPSDCSAYQNCSLAVFTGYTGSDRHGNTMTTATQIHQINRFSAQTLYNNVRSNVSGQAQAACAQLYRLLTASLWLVLPLCPMQAHKIQRACLLACLQGSNKAQRMQQCLSCAACDGAGGGHPLWLRADLAGWKFAFCSGDIWRSCLIARHQAAAEVDLHCSAAAHQNACIMVARTAIRLNSGWTQERCYAHSTVLNGGRVLACKSSNGCACVCVRTRCACECAPISGAGGTPWATPSLNQDHGFTWCTLPVNSMFRGSHGDCDD